MNRGMKGEGEGESRERGKRWRGIQHENES